MQALTNAAGRRGLLAALVACGALAAAPAALGSTYADPTGDAGGAPDIASVEVTNDAHGTITFRIGVANQPQLATDGALLVLLDADRNDATGSSGFEYAIGLTGSGGSALLRSDGSSTSRSPAPSLVASYASGVATITINRADLSATSEFEFAVAGVRENEVDVAPDRGAWTYRVATEPLRLNVTAFGLEPKRPAAGKLVAAFLLADRSDSGETVRAGDVSCTARLGGKLLRPAVRGFVEGVPACGWKLPRNARGKRLVLSMTVRHDGAAVTRTISTKVR